ncbi:hypothetical protein ACEWY4_009952 [Coilia grayii]|uniref:Claudin n=1 Tax=Coilia grayii TaxID=363190 RepID=A0ABD1K7W9_9TELE
MRDIVEVVALSLGFLSWVTVGISLQDQHWRESSGDGSVIITNAIYENLWTACATDSAGTYNCFDFQSMLALPGYIQVCRACMILAVVLGAFGITSTLFGMQCSKVADDNYILKGRMVAVGGFCFLLQGLSTMVAVSWYAYSITEEFFDDLYLGNKYEFGTGMYIGWGSAGLSLLSGSLLMCACNMESADNPMDLPSEPLTTTYKIGRSQSESTCSHYQINAYV